MLLYDREGAPLKKRKSERDYHAVGIVTGQESCAAVHALAKTRFLSAEAPRLPLPACDAAHCNCRYRHFEDRRGGPRRAEEKSGLLSANVTDNRRVRGGRRASDLQQP